MSLSTCHRILLYILDLICTKMHYTSFCHPNWTEDCLWILLTPTMRLLFHQVCKQYSLSAQGKEADVRQKGQIVHKELSNQSMEEGIADSACLGNHPIARLPLPSLFTVWSQRPTQRPMHCASRGWQGAICFPVCNLWDRRRSPLNKGLAARVGHSKWCKQQIKAQYPLLSRIMLSS